MTANAGGESDDGPDQLTTTLAKRRQPLVLFQSVTPRSSPSALMCMHREFPRTPQPQGRAKRPRGWARPCPACSTLQPRGSRTSPLPLPFPVNGGDPRAPSSSHPQLLERQAHACRQDCVSALEPSRRTQAFVLDDVRPSVVLQIPESQLLPQAQWSMERSHKLYVTPQNRKHFLIGATRIFERVARA